MKFKSKSMIKRIYLMLLTVIFIITSVVLPSVVVSSAVVAETIAYTVFGFLVSLFAGTLAEGIANEYELYQRNAALGIIENYTVIDGGKQMFKYTGAGQIIDLVVNGFSFPKDDVGQEAYRITEILAHAVNKMDLENLNIEVTADGKLKMDYNTMVYLQQYLHDLDILSQASPILWSEENGWYYAEAWADKGKSGILTGLQLGDIYALTADNLTPGIIRTNAVPMGTANIGLNETRIIPYFIHNEDLYIMSTQPLSAILNVSNGYIYVGFVIERDSSSNDNLFRTNTGGVIGSRMNISKTTHYKLEGDMNSNVTQYVAYENEANDWLASVRLGEMYMNTRTGELYDAKILLGAIPDLRLMIIDSQSVNDWLKSAERVFEEEKVDDERPPFVLPPFHHSPLNDLINRGIEAGIIPHNPIVVGSAAGVETVGGLTPDELLALLNGTLPMPTDLTGIMEMMQRILGRMPTNAELNSILELMKTQTATQVDILEAIRELTKTKTGVKNEFDVELPAIYDKFPFSIPFDLYNIFHLLSEKPITPVFDIPISNKEAGDRQVGGQWYGSDGRKKSFVIDYNISVDFSDYEWIAVIVRWLIYLAFVVFLILRTNNLIGRT